MAISILIPIFLTPYMTSTLGHEIYGLWILLSSMMIYFSLSSLGFGITLTKEISQTENSEMINKYLSTMFIFLILMSFIITIIFMILLINFNSFFVISNDILYTAKITFIIIFTMFIVNSITSIFNALLFAKGMLHIQSTLGIIQAIISAILTFLVLYYGYSIVAIALVNLILTLLSAIVIFYITKSRIDFKITREYFDINILKSMAIPSFHYFFISLAAMVVLYSDNIVISSFLGLASVAVYSIGYRVVDISQKLLFQLVDIMIPDIAKLYGAGEYDKVLKLHNKVLALSILLGFTGYGILFYWGVDIIELWVGKEFTIDLEIFRVFVLFGLWHTWVHVSAIFIVAMGIHKETSYMGMLDAILNVLFSIILLQYYGLFGVALGTLIAHLMTNGWFTNYWFYKNIKLKINQKKIIQGDIR